MTGSGVTITVDGESVPLDDCAWMERKSCGCYTAAVIAHVEGAWTLATEEQAADHFDKRADHSYEVVTMPQYWAICNRPGGWGCEQHPDPYS